MNLNQVTPAEILRVAYDRKPTALEKMCGLLWSTALHEAASALSEEADLQMQHLAELMAGLHAPDAQQNVLDLLMEAAATAARLAYAKGRADQKVEYAPLLADPFDRWIRITPETLPHHLQPVHIWIDTLKRSEPVFYDRDLNVWCCQHDGGKTIVEDGAYYYRVGSRPPEEPRHA
jgi:hypothetical protein